MLRFIDLKGQIYPLDSDPCFAWFSTVTDMFEDFDGKQHWNSLEAFIHDYKHTSQLYKIPNPLERYLNLIPEGYFPCNHKWISVKQSLPDENKKVLVTNGEYMEIGYFYDISKDNGFLFAWQDLECIYRSNSITH